MIFLQETHMSMHMYEKIKKFGYTNSFFHSHNNWRRRGAITLISNTGNIEMIEEDEDKEGRYRIVKGRIDSILVRLLNMYAPPEGDQNFFKLIFDKITSKSEGILICGGDWNKPLH